MKTDHGARRAMRGLILPSVVGISLSAAVAQAQPVAAGTEPTVVEIGLENFRYEPGTIRLEHGRPYELRFVNRSDGGHDFVAKRFFEAAAVAPEDAPKIGRGAVKLGGGERQSVRLRAPGPGRYPVHCSHFLHSTFGMKGEIIVS